MMFYFISFGYFSELRNLLCDRLDFVVFVEMHLILIL